MRAAIMAAILAALATGSTVYGAGMGWQSGVHYHRIMPAPAPRTADQPVEVIEFFWYGCSHCYQFEPFVTKWLDNKPEGVNFTQIPVMFGGAANLHAQAYYALEVTGDLERVHEKLFHAMHEQKKKLRTREELEAWLQANGVDIEAFRAAYDSFAVNAKINRANALMRRYGVRGVPAIVVDGRFRSGDGFRGYDDMIEVTNYLVDKVKNAESATASAN